MIPLITAILPTIGKVLDRLIPDKEAAAEAKRELERMDKAGELQALEADIKLSLAQIDVNKAEAESGSLFVSGWRPAVGWVCVSGLAYTFLGRPMIAWATGIVSPSTPMPPTLDLGDLMTLLMGMLGLGGYRTYEKLRGVAAK